MKKTKIKKKYEVGRKGGINKHPKKEFYVRWCKRCESWFKSTGKQPISCKACYKTKGSLAHRKV